MTPSHQATVALQTGGGGGLNTVIAPQGTAMALHCSVIAVVPQIHECIVGVHDVKSQDELTCDILLLLCAYSLLQECILHI
jgi:hypothetical protein